MDLKQQLILINSQIEEAFLHNNFYVLSNLYIKQEFILTELKKINTTH